MPEIAIGGTHVLVRLANGTVKTWGEAWGSPKAYGALGRIKNPFNPTRVPEWANAVSIAAGTKFSCVALKNGKVRCAGDNSYGAMGNGTREKSLMPGDVSGITAAAKVVAGSQFACALLQDHTVQCWGANSMGQMGDGTIGVRYTPVAVQGLKDKVKDIDAGFEHVCEQLMDDTVQCWGKNTNGQLGDGAVLSTAGNKYSAVPVTPKELGAVKLLTVGGNHTCAEKADGSRFCFGDNTSGEGGDGNGLKKKSTGSGYEAVMSSVPLKVK